MDTLNSIEAEKKITIHLFVFSGKRDPSFLIEDELLVGKIISVLNSSREITPDKFDSPSKLGYRGIRIEANKFTAVIFNGAIELKLARDKLLFLEDEKRKLEQLILDAIGRNKRKLLNGF